MKRVLTAWPPLRGGLRSRRRAGLPVAFLCALLTGYSPVWGFGGPAPLFAQTADSGRLVQVEGVTDSGRRVPLATVALGSTRLVIAAPDKRSHKPGSIVKVEGLDSLRHVGEVYLVGVDYFGSLRWLASLPALRIVVATNSVVPRPTELLRLPGLRELFVVNSRLHRELPEELSLAGTPNLEVLSFRGTALRRAPILTGPPDGLAFLDLSNCGLDLRLDGNQRLRAALESYAGIDEVNLGGNEIDETVLEAFGNLDARSPESLNE